MGQKSNWKEIKIETPANYRIRVQGKIDPEWANIIGDMRITTELKSGDSCITILAGYLVDQGALSGLLKALYDQRIPILSLENLDEKR